MLLLYFPAGFVLLLLRYLWSAARKKKGGAASAPPASRTFGGANLAVLFLYCLFLYPFFCIPAITMGDSDAEEWEKLLAVPALLAIGIYVATLLPHWLAWRILGPWRAARMGRALLAASLFRRDGDRAGARELHRARFGQGWDRRLPPASPWTIAAAALQAETEGDPERADALLGLLRQRPRKTRFPWRASAIAAEGLAGSAARRGEWERTGERAKTGQGRGVWFLRLAAAAHLGRPAPQVLLLLTWVLAPGRIAAFPLLRSALAALTSPSDSPESAESGWTEVPAIQLVEEMGLPLAHLRLLSRAATGLPVTTAEVESLARAWSGELTPAAGAALVRRGLELGGQNLADLPQVLEQSIFAELEILAEVAQGAWSTLQEGEGDPAAPLARRRVHRAFENVREEIEAFDRPAEVGADSRQMAFALEELERWLGFRARVEQLERVGGEEALATAWHNGLRTTACNWPVFLSRQRGADARWAAFLMHRWSLELATRVEDEAIAALSGKNAEGIRPFLL